MTPTSFVAAVAPRTYKIIKNIGVFIMLIFIFYVAIPLSNPSYSQC